MKHTLFLILLVFPILLIAESEPERPSTVLIHPGEVLYALFDQSANVLKLVSVSKEKNEQAQLILTMGDFKEGLLMLKAQSKFTSDLSYKAQMRMLSKNRRAETSMIPIRAGLSSFESWPHPIEELALYDFQLKQ